VKGAFNLEVVLNDLSDLLILAKEVSCRIYIDYFGRDLHYRGQCEKLEMKACFQGVYPRDPTGIVYSIAR
jgi:hypothetical protein